MPQARAVRGVLFRFLFRQVASEVGEKEQNSGQRGQLYLAMLAGIWSQKSKTDLTPFSPCVTAMSFAPDVIRLRIQGRQ